MNVNIYGGGITGLSIAHELIEKGFKVNLFEKDSIIGGMAKSKRIINDIPTEHSWRGYGPFYYNLFDLLKRIPKYENKSKENFTNNNFGRWEKGEFLESKFTLDEISKHNTIDSLWTYYKNEVYDITEWVKIHPGGNIILKCGGKDLSSVWTENNVGWHNDNENVLKKLKSYKIGTLTINEKLKGEKTVYDNLEKNVSFTLLDSEKEISTIDYPYVVYLFLKCIVSGGDRKVEYFKQNFLSLLKGRVSKKTYNYLVYFIAGSGYGFDINTMSYQHYSSFIEKEVTTNGEWKVMNGPTNESFLEHWVTYLESRGVKFYYNKEIDEIIYKKNKVLSVKFKDGKSVIADEHCLTINPYNAIEIFNKSGLKSLYEQHIGLKTINNQISFCITFSEKIFLPKDKNCFVLVDTPFNITFYSQDYNWSSDVYLGDNVKSIWSGTCINPYGKSILYDKTGINLTIDEFKKEILHQIFSSRDLLNILKRDSLEANIYIYDEWYYDEEMKSLVSENKKWVNNVYNEAFRPEPETFLSNFYIGGAHCKTSISIWSMEGAAESGKKVGNVIFNKYGIQNAYIHKFESNTFIKIIQKMDDIIYKFDLPNILDCLLFIILFIIVIKIIGKNNIKK